jgi:hypothetical protein
MKYPRTKFSKEKKNTPIHSASLDDLTNTHPPTHLTLNQCIKCSKREDSNKLETRGEEAHGNQQAEGPNNVQASRMPVTPQTFLCARRSRCMKAQADRGESQQGKRNIPESSVVNFCKVMQGRKQKTSNQQQKANPRTTRLRLIATRTTAVLPART